MEVGFKLFGILLHEGNLPPRRLGIKLQRSIMFGGNMHAIQWDTTMMAHLQHMFPCFCTLNKKFLRQYSLFGELREVIAILSCMFFVLGPMVP